MEHDPRASMTDWLQRFLSLFRAETEEVNGMPGVKISNLDDFSAPCQIHLFWFHADMFGIPSGQRHPVGSSCHKLRHPSGGR